MKYLWKSFYSGQSSYLGSVYEGQVKCKTERSDWINTPLPVVVLASVRSQFHEMEEGSLKMQALLSLISENVQGEKTFLITDCAHLHVFSLIINGDIETAKKMEVLNGNKLATRFQPFLEGWNCVFWHSYISTDSEYSSYQKKIRDKYQSDPLFRSCIDRDIKKSYSEEKVVKFPNFSFFSQKTFEDLVEQAVGLYILYKKGHRFLFYPGKSNALYDYVVNELSFFYINFDVSIVKKKKMKTALQKSTDVR